MMITKEQIIKLYINENLTRKEVANSLNIKESYLKSLIKKFGIKKPKTLHLKNIEKTCLEKYGIKNAGGSLQSLEKAKQTNLKKYGKEWALQNQDIINKRNSNNLIKYGVKNVFENKEIKERIIKNNLKKYGKKFYTQTDECKQKIKNTCLKKYGVDAYTKTLDYKQKTLKTNLERYGETSFTKTVAYKNLYKDQYYVQNKLDKIFYSKKLNNTLFKSKLEQEIIDFIKNELQIPGEKYIKGKGNDRFEIDYFIPEKNIGIEINGAWWHSINAQDHKPKDYHYKKMRVSNKYGISLIQIWEDQWYLKKDIIKDILKARLGVLKNRIYARKCIIKEVDNATYKNFCNNTHIQGYRPAKIRLGLYYDNKLVQIASFNKCNDYGKRKSKYEYEWIRGCIASNNQVIGGTSKLLKYFIKNYNPESILCYADANLFDGKGYQQAGFEFIDYTGPDKFFIENNTLIRHLRNPYKYKFYKEAVKQGKFMECYGAGSLKFVWKKT